MTKDEVLADLLRVYPTPLMVERVAILRAAFAVTEQPRTRQTKDDPLAQDGPTRVLVDLPEALYGPLWRAAVAEDTTVAALVVRALKDSPCPNNL